MSERSKMYSRRLLTATDAMKIRWEKGSYSNRQIKKMMKKSYPTIFSQCIGIKFLHSQHRHLYSCHSEDGLKSNDRSHRVRSMIDYQVDGGGGGDTPY